MKKLRRLVKKLGETGFTRRTDGILTCDLAADVLGWIGLNTATRYHPLGEIVVYPIVGIRFQIVERIISECRGEAPHAFVPPTISTPLGYLLPTANPKGWLIRTDGEDAHTSAVEEDLLDSVSSYGLPYMNSNIDLIKLCSALEPRNKFDITDYQLSYRRSVAWLLSGDASRAAVALHETIDAIKDRRDVASDEYRAFAATLRSRYFAASP